MTGFTILVAYLGLFGWLYLAFFHGRFWKPPQAKTAIDPETWPSVDIIVPARDEAHVLPQSLPALLAQNYPGAWRIILVDDGSIDGTGDIAHKIAASKQEEDRLTIVDAPELEQGWSGKVASMRAGLSHSEADYVLFTDADIEHTPDSLRQLVARAIERKLDLTSLMVKLHCRTFAEKLMIPAFVFFFAMLYPFERANNPDSDVAAAAGGVMLIRRKALNNIGGLKSIRNALIDDCALAKVIKRYGGDNDNPGRIELTLSPDVKSLRVYPKIIDIREMVARTAFTQLGYSAWLLTGTVIGLAILFLAPLFLPLGSDLRAMTAGMLALFIMILIYMPMVRFYGLPFIWAVTLPLAALIYIVATIDSARLYWQGKGGQWKGRAQAV